MDSRYATDGRTNDGPSVDQVLSSTQASNGEPRYFYKYGRVDDERICHTKRIFEANEMYFSTIDQFNDPFDCSHVLRLSGIYKEVQEYFEKISKKNKPDLNRKERRKLVKQIMKQCKSSNGSVSFEGHPEEIMKINTNKWGMYCLSETCDNIQMWAHYADGHRGFCLEFLNDEGNPFFVPAPSGAKVKNMAPLKVQYSDQFPIINRVSDDSDAVAKKALLTKASGWSYEKEWRMVDLSGSGRRIFSPHFLKSVIFGFKMSDDHKRLIRKWCGSRDPAITFREALISAGSYSLEISLS